MLRLVGLALLWGSGFLWIKLSLRGFTPVQIVLVRLALGALILAPIGLARGMRKHLTNRGIPSIMLSASQLAAGAGWMLLAMPFGGLVAPHWRWDAVAPLVVLGVLGTGVAYVLNYRLIADEGPTVASTTTYLLPVVAVVLGALVVNEPVTVSMVAGMLIVLGGVFLVQRTAARKSEPEPEPVAVSD